MKHSGGGGHIRRLTGEEKVRGRTENCPRCGSFSAHECAGSALAPTSPAPPGSLPPPAGQKITSEPVVQDQCKCVKTDLLKGDKQIKMLSFSSVHTEGTKKKKSLNLVLTLVTSTITFLRWPSLNLKISSCSWYSACDNLRGHRNHLSTTSAG